MKKSVKLGQDGRKRSAGGKRNLAQELIAERRRDTKNVTPSRRARSLLQAMQDKATTSLSTDEIMALTRNA